MNNVARGEKARRIAHGYVGWAVGAGLIPFPLVDVGSLVVLQVKMLTEIAVVYDISLERERARTLVMGTVGGLAPQGVALTGIPALLKFVPVLGTLLGIAVMPAAAAASTLALADLFIRHIETHGRPPDRTDPRLPHAQPAAPAAAEVVVGEAAVTDVPAEQASGETTQPPVTNATVDEAAVPPPATTEQTATEEPDAAAPDVGSAAASDTPSDDLREGATADEDRTGSEPDEPDDVTAPADPEPVADPAHPVRRRHPSARSRRRSPSTETS